MTEFPEIWKRYVSMVEESLPGFLPEAKGSYKNVIEAMDYSLTGGGKRVRGVLLLAVYRLFCSEAEVSRALPFAAALEMIHAYSMIHDDLPCMDDDNLRRGKPSCHIAFGEDTALLAGDALLTLAFETATGPRAVRHFGSERALAAANVLSVAAGAEGMIGGQVMDLANEGKKVSLETLRETDEKKTGALISVAARIGCILGGAGAEVTRYAVDYALQLGLAFQILDDILDQTSDSATLGKPIGSDAENEKSTYTSHYGIEGARKVAAGLNAGAKESIRATGLEADFLCQMADMLLERTF